MTKTRTYNLRGAIRLSPDADPQPVAGALPEGACDVLGTLTVGPSLPGALALYPFPATDYDDTHYPYTLVYVRDGQWHRLPMKKTIKAILDHGYQIQPRPWKLHQGDMGYEFVKI
jgi:hypothetical protein